MTDEKPLHVRVAEALGWTHISLNTWHQRNNWAGMYPGGAAGSRRIPRYDTDWAATGPLIERIPITVGRYMSPFMDGAWYATAPGPSVIQSERTGATPLVAVCNLILALKEAGNLP